MNHHEQIGQLGDLSHYHAERAAIAWRVVETQEIAATKAITGSAADQSRLEELLEHSKPKLPDDCRGLDYLLFTPFRYPPLDQGSRFGSRFERGIFYGSEEIKTAFAEVATYLWLFQSGPLEQGPLANIRDQRTLFSASVASAAVLDLSTEPFDLVREALNSPDNWSASQYLGSKIRDAGTDYFYFLSARLSGGANIAVVNPQAFAVKAPLEQQHWHLSLDPQRCWFGCRQQSVEFSRTEFEVGGKIPHPYL